MASSDYLVRGWNSAVQNKIQKDSTISASLPFKRVLPLRFCHGKMMSIFSHLIQSKTFSPSSSLQEPTWCNSPPPLLIWLWLLPHRLLPSCHMSFLLFLENARHVLPLCPATAGEIHGSFSLSCVCLRLTFLVRSALSPSSPSVISFFCLWHLAASGTMYNLLTYYAYCLLISPHSLLEWKLQEGQEVCWFCSLSWPSWLD